MKFGRFEIPPVFKKEESEEQKGSYEHAPQPAPLDEAELMSLAKKGDVAELTSVLSTYAENVNNYAVDRGVYTGRVTAPMWDTIREVGKLTQALESEYGREDTLAKLEDAFSRVNGEYTDAVIERVTRHQDGVATANARVQEGTVAENRNDLKEAVAKHSTLEEDNVLSMKDVLKRKLEEGNGELEGSLMGEQSPTQGSEPEDVIVLGDESRIDEANAAEPSPEPESPKNEDLPATEEPLLRITYVDRSHLVPTTQGTRELVSKEIPRPDPLASHTANLELIQREMERAAELKEMMLHAEGEYLEAYREHYATRGAKEKNESDFLKGKKQMYDATRVAYGNALNTSARERLAQKYGYGEKEDAYSERVLARYNRLVRYNEIIRPAAEKRYQTRVEAMDSREKGILKKGLAWFGEQNKKLEERYGKTRARVIRAVGVTAIAGTAGVLTGALASVGVLGAAGWAGMRMGRALLSSFAAANVGALTGEAAGVFLKRGKRKAEEKLTAVGRTEAGLTIDDLEKIDDERMALEKNADERVLQNRQMIARALGAFVAGAGIGALDGALNAPDESAATAPKTGIAEPTSKVAPIPEVQPKVADVPESEPVRHIHPTDESSNDTQGAATPEPRQIAVDVSGTPEVQEPRQIAVDVTGNPEKGVPVPSEESAAEQSPSPEPAANSTYSGEFSEVKSLPEGMDPESPEAVAYLNKAYNPKVFESASASAAETQTVPIQQAEPTAETSTAQPTTEQTAPANETVTQQEVQKPVPSTETATPKQPDYQPSYTASEPETSSTDTAVPEAPAANSSAPTAEVAPAGAFTNPYGVMVLPDEPRVYAVPDPSEQGKENLIVFGSSNTATGKDLLTEVSRVAKSQPGVPVYFQSPEPTRINGIPQQWVASATASKTGEVIFPVMPDPTRPELVGVTINPNTFIRAIN